MRKPAESTGARLLEVAERERLLMGDELHESLCQHLAAASLAIGLLMRRSETGKVVDSSDLAELVTLIQRATGESRSFVRQLKAVPSEVESLMKLLDELASFASRTIPCEFICEKIIYVRDRLQALAIYRISQEAIRNALKHSHARQIILSLREESGRVIVEIRDDGCGFSLPLVSHPIRGIKFMRYLASLAGAKLQINSAAKPGTQVVCTLPIVE